MCQQHQSEEGVESSARNQAAAISQSGSDSTLEPFPWDIGVFDAHCHPTDTMASIPSISGMKARVLTVMSTRLQDQELVSAAAKEQGVSDIESSYTPQTSPSQRIVPSFGWHPWFSHQIYDDSAATPTYDGTQQGKRAHYDKILSPAPSSRDPTFSDGLPDPRPLSEFLKETRLRLEAHPFALVGEIGLDKAFRLPGSWTSADQTERDDGLTPGGREGRRLSPHRVAMEHQVAVLKAQLRLAGEMDRPVSVHGVQVHGGVYNAISDCWKGHELEVLSRRERRRIAENAEDFVDSSDDEDEDEKLSDKTKQVTLKPKASKAASKGPNPYPPRICLHSFSGSVSTLRQYTEPTVPAKVFFSFSVAVNWGSGGVEKTEEAIRAVRDDRILVESDLHIAGDQMDGYLEDVCRRVCQIKGWDLRQGVEKLARNWRDFVFGDVKQ